MKFINSLAVAFAVALVGTPALATEGDPHHPEASGTNSMPAKPSGGMTAMDSQMGAMHEMHDKMMAAKTPADRDALMAEQMKVMQDSMTMMNGMSPGAMKNKKSDMAARHPTMEKRMEMMQATMQMMMDRLPVVPAK